MQKRLTLATVAILFAIIGLLPVVAMVFFVNGGFSAKAYDVLLTTSKQQALPMAHSLLLSFFTSALATIAGVALGLLLGTICRCATVSWRCLPCRYCCRPM